MVLIMIIGILAVCGGLFLLIKKMKKILGIAAIAVGAVFMLFGLFSIVFGDDPDDNNKPVSTEQPRSPIDSSFIDVNNVEGLQTEDNKISLNTGYASISIEPDDTGKLDANENPSVLHPEDKITGVTEDGIQWSSSKKDGTAPIHMNVNGKPVSAKVNAKADSKTGSKDKADTGKAAAAVAKVVNTGYKKGTDNYDHNYSIWYVEVARCLVYYPSQLKISAVYEDNSLLFKDTMSEAYLRVTLDENNYSCMDDVESFIANTEYNHVLASGTDWYSCEYSNKDKTEFTVTGLGQLFAVNVSLTYENKYSFVFEELRKLIKCKFIEDGIWVSNARVNTTGKKVPVLQNKYANGLSWNRTSWYFGNWDCVMYYPDVFIKAYSGDNGCEYFTDPVTGAYIEMRRSGFEGTLNDITSKYDFFDYDIDGEYSVRGSLDTSSGTEYHYVAIRDGYEYHATMYVSKQYEELYSRPANDLSVALPGEDISSIEMQDIYFSKYNCYITVPLQFRRTGNSGDSYYYRDSFNDMEMSVKFVELTAATDTGDIFDMFEVVADDEDIAVGNNIVKWHNQNGLNIGCLGAHYSCLLEMTYPNAATAYQNTWKRMSIRFEEKAKAVTPADRVEKDIRTAKVAAKVAEAQVIAGITPVPTAAPTPVITDSPDAPEATATPTPVPVNADKPAATPIVAEPVKHELPQNTDWMSDSVENVVLWYKDYDDYKAVATTAETWFKSEMGGTFFADEYKFLVLANINAILRYNEYKVDISNDWLAYDGIDQVEKVLEKWYYSNPPESSQLGAGITSVFEAYCQVLNMDIPDYVSNAPVPPEVSEEKVSDSERPVPTTAPTSGATVTPETVVPDGNDNKTDYTGLLVGIWDLQEAGMEVPECDRFVIYENGVWIGAAYGEPVRKGVISVLSPDGYLLGVELYNPDASYYMKLTYTGSNTLQTGNSAYILSDDDPHESGFDSYIDGNGTNNGTSDDHTVTGSNPIAQRVGRDTVYEDIAYSLRVDLLGETDGTEMYGNISRLSYYHMIEQDFYDFIDGVFAPEIKEFVKALESVGITYRDEIIIEVGWPAYAYSGVLEGYEEYGALTVIISCLGEDEVDVCWTFENRSNMPTLPGEMMISDTFCEVTKYRCPDFDYDSEYEYNTRLMWYAAEYADTLYSHTIDRMKYYDYADSDQYYYLFTGEDMGVDSWFGLALCTSDSAGSLDVVAQTFSGYDTEKSDWYLSDNLSGDWEMDENYR